MAELLSVQVHVPLVRDYDGSLDCRQALVGGQPARLKKVENRSAASTGGGGLMINHSAQQQRTINIEFRDLSYTVSEGRSKGQ
jgi:hypothetical protein